MFIIETRPMENKESSGTNGDKNKRVLEKVTDFIEKVTSGTLLSENQQSKKVSHFDAADVDEFDEPEPEYDEDDPEADV